MCFGISCFLYAPKKKKKKKKIIHRFLIEFNDLEKQGKNLTARFSMLFIFFQKR